MTILIIIQIILRKTAGPKSQEKSGFGKILVLFASLVGLPHPTHFSIFMSSFFWPGPRIEKICYFEKFEFAIGRDHYLGPYKCLKSQNLGETRFLDAVYTSYNFLVWSFPPLSRRRGHKLTFKIIKSLQ